MNPTPEPIYRLDGVSKEFAHPEGGRQAVLREISAELPGGMTAIRGVSGEGKSTLLHVLAGLDAPTTGEVHFQGERIDYASRRRLGLFRRRVGVVFQENNLVPHLTVGQNVALPAIGRGMARQPALEQARLRLAELGMEIFWRQAPYRLSGGQKQRVCMARALAGGAEVILADEPTGSLDAESAEQVMMTLRELCDLKEIPVIIVTHNLELAERFCEHHFELKEGHLLETPRAATDLVPAPPLHDRFDPEEAW